MSKTLGKWGNRLGTATSVGLVASFCYFAIGNFDEEMEAPPPGPSLSEEFQNESHTGSPLRSVLRPVARPAEPITINLGNGLGLHFDNSKLLFSSADLVNHAMYDAEYDNHVAKSAELHAGLLALSQMTPMSYQAYEAVAWKETRFQDGAENPSGAKGYFQLQPDAFYESLYRIRDDFPEIADITSLVTRRSVKIEGQDSYILHYEPIDEEARAHLDQLVHDPLIGGLAYYGYIRHFMENFVQKNIPDIEPNQTDLYLISFRGPGGATEFLQNLRNNSNDPAHNMYEGGAAHPFVDRNKSVYYDEENNHWRSYQEVYDYIADHMHVGRAPVSFETKGDTPQTASLIALEQELQDNIIPADSLIFAENLPKPQPRPALLIATDQRDMRQAGMSNN